MSATSSVYNEWNIIRLHAGYSPRQWQNSQWRVDVISVAVSPWWLISLPSMHAGLRCVKQVKLCKLARPFQCIVLTRPLCLVYTIQPVVKPVEQPVVQPSWQPVVLCKRGIRVSAVDTYIPWLTGYTMLPPLPSARIAYAGIAANLPLTATNHVTLLTYWRSSASVIGSANRYSSWQLKEYSFKVTSY